MKKSDLIIYRIVTALLSLLLLFSASMYFLQYPMISETFLNLGFPTFVIYPLAVAKILAVLVIWINKSKMLKEWAYAGIVFNLLLAMGAHLCIGDGEQMGAIMGLVLVTISYFFHRKIYNTYVSEA